MSKTNKNEELKNDKVMTKYDRKMQEKKEKAAKAKKQDFVSKWVTAIVVVVLIAAVAVSVIFTVKNRNKIVDATFMTIGEHEISNIEYDYYYNIMLTNYLNNYSALLPYMGYDTSVDPDLQFYDDTRTWGDFFDQITVEQIKETKAMVDDGKAKGFVYETEDKDYKSFVGGFQSQATANGLTLSEYYTQCFGKDATPARLETFMRETLYASAYLNKLMADYAPAEDEIVAKYEENKNNYDRMTYKLYTFTADDTVTMEDIAAKANAMKDAVVAGEDFQALCDKYDEEVAAAADFTTEEDSTEEETVENSNTVEETSYVLINSLFADWLYDNARTAGEVEVFADEDNSKYYVVQYVEKVVDMDAIKLTISNEVASEFVAEYRSELLEAYEVKDVAGELRYLTLPAAE